MSSYGKGVNFFQRQKLGYLTAEQRKFSLLENKQPA